MDKHHNTVLGVVFVVAAFSLIVLFQDFQTTGAVSGLQKIETSSFEPRDAWEACRYSPTECTGNLPGEPVLDDKENPLVHKNTYVCTCASGSQPHRYYMSIYARKTNLKGVSPTELN